MNTFIKIILSVLLLCTFQSLSANIRLPHLISDGMILQRESDLKIWGWATPKEKVSVEFQGKKYQTTTTSEGTWEVTIPPLKAGGPHSMIITGKNKIEIENILIGDVWICSGQSNMTHYFGRHQERYAKEIAEANYPEIRQLYVPTKAILTKPSEDNENFIWEESNPESILDFTVVGYFFALKLHESYNVPIGIINTAVGGTKIEAWTSEEGFKDFPKILKKIEQNKDTSYVNSRNRKAAAERKQKARKSADKGRLSTPSWYETNYEPLNWKPINVPGYWQDQGLNNLKGVVWYRREINVPRHMIGTEALVKLGRIIDADEFYLNGKRIGGTGYQYPQREYTVPKDLLKPGKNLFVVRVSGPGNQNGFIPDKPYFLLANNDTIDLKGTWEYKVGEVFPSIKYETRGIRAQDQPTALFNGMIAPFTNYSIKGAIWYQGESNASDPDSYQKYLPNLIADWRSQWNNHEMPFFIAQLPNYMAVDYSPVDSEWASMRDIQLQTALNDPNCGLGINIDLGEWNDIHPGNKKPVGERLALQAMEIAYGEKDLVSSGPIYKSHRIENGKIRITFDHVGSGLISNNGEELGHFAIAGTDGKFIWANSKIEDNQVVVWSEAVDKPKFVRYAWANNPDFANLSNKEGLPASPFQIIIN